jgi:hypothetical protein
MELSEEAVSGQYSVASGQQKYEFGLSKGSGFKLRIEFESY